MFVRFAQELYCVRSDLGNLLKALGRLDEAKVGQSADKQLRQRMRVVDAICVLCDSFVPYLFTRVNIL